MLDYLDDQNESAGAKISYRQSVKCFTACFLFLNSNVFTSEPMTFPLLFFNQQCT
jgi:hypothetical protein